MSELYELPDGWEWKKLPDIVQIGCKKGFSPTITDGKVPFIGMSNIDEQGGRNTVFELEDFTKVSKGKVKFQKDAILVGKITPCTQNNKVTIVPKNIDGGYATTEVYALHALEHLLPLYLNYFIRSNSINEYLVSTMIGATGRQRVPSEAIKNLDIPLPPLPEQQRIVSKLDLLFEKIDKSIALHQKNMDEANAFMGSVLNDVFGELEEKYEKVALGKITTTTSGGTPKRNEKSYWGGKIGWLKSGELNNGYINEVEEFITDEGLKKSSAKLFPKGTLLIAIYGATVGKLGILNIATTTNQAICGVLNDKNLFETKYMFYFFQKSKAKMLLDSTGGAQPNISQTYIKQLEVVFPPLPIQQKTVIYLDEISQKIEKIKQLQKEKMASLKALKASILDSAFRGEL